MSKRHQFTAIATTGALRQVADELRQEFKELIENQSDDIKIIKEQLLMLSHKING